MNQANLAHNAQSSLPIVNGAQTLGRSTLTTRPSLRVLQPLQRPIIAEIDLFDMAELMDRIEPLVRGIDGNRAISKFKLWEPMFCDLAAMREPVLFEQITRLVEAYSGDQLQWQRASVPTHSDPIIFTALPLPLCQKILDHCESGPEFLFTSRWSLHALPTLARQSILDDFLD
jgi:hypothetical protein